MTEAVFLGTGNFLADGRYWNSFVLDRTILVEPCPTSLPHLRRVGVGAGDLEAIVISHFHPDHTFGWPFLLLEILMTARRDGAHPTYVIGPPGVEQYLRDMNELGSIHGVQAAAEHDLDLRFVEVDGTDQQAGALRFRAVEVDHVPHLRCFGYLFERDGRTIGYSGDTRLCDGLRQLARASDALILECNGPHIEEEPVTHMDEASVRALRDEFPGVPFVLTHMGVGLDVSGIDELIVPEDFDRLQL